ncbi:hypothetical protein N7470_009456 [Penicillium chermesinum]|nr:hypothetical protein N7470_009456 [Penicillium chermesinum]
MAPIRVGLIGLSSTSTSFAAGAWAAKAHLPWLLKSPDYKLVALANSSVEAAKASIKAHGLPAETRAYGTPEEIANDPDVDLVVVSVNVAKHYDLIKPALHAKKDAFVEWPLGANTTEAAELTELAKANGVKTVVGLQARADPIVIKTKEIVQSGVLGNLTSSNVVVANSAFPTQTWFAGAEYYLSKDSGGNMLTIFFGHFDFEDALPTATIVDGQGKVVQENYPRTAPDHLLVQGTLENGALASISVRATEEAVDDVGFCWVITGTKGELELTRPPGSWQTGPPEGTLRLRVGKNAAEAIDFSTIHSSDVATTEEPNMAAVYDAFAKGQDDRFSTFESSLRVHKLLDRIVQAS